MKISDIFLFLIALVLFVFGVDYMVTQKSGKSPIKLESLLVSLKNSQDSELNQALRKVTSKAKEKSPKLTNTDLFSGKKEHIDFLLGRPDYKLKACDFIESEFQTFDYKNQSTEALGYLEKIYLAYFVVQKDAGKSAQAYLDLTQKMSGHPLLKLLEQRLIESYPNDKDLLMTKLNPK
jgi:hypothetical protein